MRRFAATVCAVTVLASCGSDDGSEPAQGTAPSTSTVAPSAAGTPAPRSPSRASSPSAILEPSRSSAPSLPSLPSAPSASAPARATAVLAGGAPLVVLNPGHNGANAAHLAEINRLVPAGFGQMKACDTTGTSTDAGFPEHAFNWDLAVRVRDLLAARGVRVVLTRPDDNGVGPCVDERAAIGNRAGVSAVVSIHADGAPSSGHGFHVCEASVPPAGGVTAARSHALTVAVHDALARSSGLGPSTYLGQNGYFPRNDLAGLNLATVPATFIELGNMRNPQDAALQSSPAGRARIAGAVADGIIAYLNGL